MALVHLIEDDAAIRSALARTLTERGHAVVTSSTGMAGLQQVVETAPDLVVLDLGLPDVDGLRLLQMLRAVSAVPVIVATARDDDASVVRALDAGADDYLIKPFAADQLEARIRAVLRRAGQSAAEDAGPIVVGGLAIDSKSRVVTLEGRPLDLSRLEFDLLNYLAMRPGEVVTKKQLLTDVWRQVYGGADKTVDVHLSWLRRKLGETAAEPRYLHSVRGVGIKLVAPAGP